MIRDYLFDIGKVILDFDFGISAARLAPLSEVDGTEILPGMRSLMIGLETGALSTQQFAAQGMELIGFSGKADDFVHAFQDVFTVNAPMVNLIDELADAGSRLFLLSNTSDLHVTWFIPRYSVFQRFHGAAYSHEAGCMKPDPGIFRYAIERFGFAPEEVLFIDDSPANVAAAEELGFTGLVYDLRDHAGFLDRFRSLDSRRPRCGSC